jgi:myo-inositol-1-phosphate synthase
MDHRSLDRPKPDADGEVSARVDPFEGGVLALTKPIPPATGKLGLLFPGMGAVTTTTIAGVLLVRGGQAVPVGSITQLGRLAMEGRSAHGLPMLRDVLPLASLDQLHFGGWDIFEDNAYETALGAGVLGERDLERVRDQLRAVKPMNAVFYPGYVRRLHGTHVKRASSKAEMVDRVRADIRRFKSEEGCERLVAVWCGSTEIFLRPSATHATVRSFERGLTESSDDISNAQIYAWACLQERVPFANGSPNLCVDFPAALELARERAVPVAGKDFKTGQTMLKTALAPALKARMLGVRGWYSTNILGNRDGAVLDDPESFRAKEATKLGVLEQILLPELNPRLYGDLIHKVRIDFYPPRGDAKEAWDSIDLFGWLGYPMQIKVDFQGRDSILAAPLVLDLALLLDLAARAGWSGPQDWLSFFFKSPSAAAERVVEHNLFVQQQMLEDALRRMATKDADARLDA